MKYSLIVCVFFITGLTLASTPNYTDTKNKIEEEAESRREATAGEIQFNTVPFGNEVVPDDVTQGQTTGQFSTALSRREGEPSLQERFRAQSLQWQANKIAEIAEFKDDLTDKTERITRHADGDESNGGLDILAQQETADENQHGPMAKKSKPAFAEESSNSLNPEPHAPSQQGDLCMSAEGNSAELSVDPVAPTYDNACEGSSFAEHSDCTMGAVKEINSESKGASANSTQVMQPVTEPNRQQLQTSKQASNEETANPTCPTAPRLAESKMSDIANLIKSDRQSFEQANLVGGRTSSALSLTPNVETYVQQKFLPWYKILLAWVIPSTAAHTTTLRGETGNTGLENELAKKDFAKFLSDLNTYPDMAGEQQFAKNMSQMMEEQNKIKRTKLQLSTQLRENLEDIANLKKKPL